MAVPAVLLAALLPAASAGAATVPSTAAAQAVTSPRIDLKVLVVDDGSVGVTAIAGRLAVEGVPYTRVNLADPARATITPAFLASGSEAKFEAVVLPDADGGTLAAAELAALTAYEAAFGIRQVDAYDWARPAVGLNFAASPGFIGELTGVSATVTEAAKADGFGYSTGTLPLSSGSWSYLATPAGIGTMPEGGSFTPFVTATIPGSSAQGSLLGVYRQGGVEKLVITTSLSQSQSHFAVLAHGIISWATRGVHFGYNRNYLTFHFDDAFSADARWDVNANCTPGEDCQFGVTPSTPDIRMTAADVSYLVGWQQSSGYTVTLPFNGYYALNDSEGNPYNGTDALTNAFVAAKDQFRWLSHGFQHVYQGCVQVFSNTAPWSCTTTPAGQAPAADGSNITWTSQADVASEITSNIAAGQALGLPFDPKEYLSGEHSGLRTLPQQPVDNPGFTAAVSGAGLTVIGADASREAGARAVGTATTVPRHPVAVYYNVSTEAEEVSEYNWFYAPASAGGNCTATATTTCMSGALDPATGFKEYILPSDAAYDLGFVLGNDPRPFYAHVSNLTGPDYLGLQLLDAILSRYRASFAANAPTVNLTMTEAAQVLSRQQAWTTAGLGASPAVSGYVQNGVVTVTSSSTAAAPITLPTGTTSGGAAFGEQYGSEASGWVTGSATFALPGAFLATTGAPFAAVPGSTPAGTGTAGSGTTGSGTTGSGTADAGTGTGSGSAAGGSAPGQGNGSAPSAPSIVSEARAVAATGTPFSFTVHTSGSPAPVITAAGTLPAGLRLTDRGNGTATLTGTVPATVRGTYRLTLTARNTAGTATQALTLVVGQAPRITSAAAVTTSVGTPVSRVVTTTGSGVTTRVTGKLPAGITFRATSTGGVLSGRAARGTGGVYRLVVTASNAYGRTSRVLVVTVRATPAFTSARTATVTAGKAAAVAIRTTGYPAATLKISSGRLPAGMVLRSTGKGSASITGTPRTRGRYSVVVRATSSTATASQTLVIVVR